MSDNQINKFHIGARDDFLMGRDSPTHPVVAARRCVVVGDVSVLPARPIAVIRRRRCR